MPSRLPIMAALMLDALDDLDRAIQDVAPDEEVNIPIVWICGHLGQHIDSWVVHALAGQPQHEYLRRDAFAKGASGQGADCRMAYEAFREIVRKARTFLETVGEEALQKSQLYAGSVAPLKGKKVTGNYRLARLIAHIYYHIGDISNIRAKLGYEPLDFPSTLPRTSNTAK